MSGPEGGVRRALGYADLARRGFSLKRADEERVRANAREHLIQRLGRLRGLPQKIGQLLSFSADEDTAEAFRPLTDSIEPLPLEVIEQALEAAWGRKAAELVTLEPEGHAASLGQVHRGRLVESGQEVAVKVQYPGVRSAIEQDLGALGWLSAPVGDLRQGFDLGAYREEIRRDLEEELDYRHEARQQERFRALCQGGPWIVPRLHPELCTDQVLVSDWEGGRRLQEVKAAWTAEARGDLAFELVRLFSLSVLGEGFFHADPHEGNYAFRLEKGEPRVVLYDFGSTLELRERERLALLRLIRTAGNPGSEDPYRLWVALGFDRELLEPLAELLPALTSLLFAPYRQPLKFDLDTWELGERVGDVLGEHRWNFRISAPARLLFLMRAWQGLIHQLRELGEPASWRIPADPYLRRDAERIDALELPQLERRSSFSDLARHLRVEVLEDGRQKVKVSLPVATVDRLEDLLEPELLERIAASGVSLAEKKREIRQRAYRPQEIFTQHEGSRAFRVWLE